MVKRLIKLFTSMKLTVVLLTLAMVLVFIGTLAQVHEGLYIAQSRYFKSWLIVAPHIGPSKVPIVFPGGYLIGTLLLVNLLSAHLARFALTWRKTGIHLTHGGLSLLLLGQLLTDVLSRESAMRLAEGESRNYSVDFQGNELVVIDTSDPKHDEVVSIPESLVAKQGEIRDTRLPATLKVLKYWPNADLLTAPGSNALFTAGTSISAAAAVSAGTGPYTVADFTNSGAGNTVFQSA